MGLPFGQWARTLGRWIPPAALAHATTMLQNAKAAPVGLVLAS
jgi:hypothetical protein